MPELEIFPFYQGLSVGLGLIAAIGAQNAFVIKQGILKNQVFIIVLTCFIIDAILIALGVGGFGKLISSSTTMLSIAKYGGAAFLALYGLRSFRNVFKEEVMYLSNDNSKLSAKKAFVTVLALSLLNPHVYLDTCVLIGTIGSQFDVGDRLYFALGAIIASFIWFFTIGYGARLLLPVFQNPIAWKILDFLTGVIMLAIACSLLMWDHSAQI